MRKMFLIGAIIIGSLLQAQDGATISLSFDAYMDMVLENHPMASAASLQLDRGDAILQSARGGFDPVLEGGLNRKDFDGKRYYDLIGAGLKVPTWLGATVDAGYNQNEGLFMNPQSDTPDNGLVHIGVSVPLGKGLFIDRRRAELRKAQIAQDLAFAERVLLMNDLLLEAGSAYWNWFEAHHSMSVYVEARELAQQRLDAVIQSAQFGDKPYIDTLEASIQVQNRNISLNQAELELANTAAAMSVYLWLDGYVPMELANNTVPLDIEDIAVEAADPMTLFVLDSLVTNHPLLQTERGAIASSIIDQRWKAEQLKPQLDLKYNVLTESVGGVETQGFNSQDYALGLVFKMPILLRKERGGLQLAKIKLEQRELKLVDKQQDVWLKAKTALNTQTTTASQVELYTRTVRDYNSLLFGERDLFQSGESSLFLVNSRERGYVQAQIKLIALISKNRSAALKTQHALSTLNTRL